MNNGWKVGCLLLPALSLTAGCQNTGVEHKAAAPVQSLQVSKVVEPLSLQLDITSATTERIDLVATLTNTSTEDVTLNLPRRLNPLTVLVWSTDGYSLTHRISRRLQSESYEQQQTIAAGQSWVIEASVDLTQYKNAIMPNGQTFVSAQYDSISQQGDYKLPSLVYSNKIYLSPKN